MNAVFSYLRPVRALLLSLVLLLSSAPLRAQYAVPLTGIDYFSTSGEIPVAAAGGQAQVEFGFYSGGPMASVLRSTVLQAIDENGDLVTRASLQMFVINGHNTMPSSTSDVEMWWHTHPNTTINGVSLGSSNPSTADYKGQKKMTARGYKGNTFVIGVRSNTVTFFNKNRALITVDWTDFIKMGRQEK